MSVRTRRSASALAGLVTAAALVTPSAAQAATAAPRAATVTPQIATVATPPSAAATTSVASLFAPGYTVYLTEAQTRMLAVMPCWVTPPVWLSALMPRPVSPDLGLRCTEMKAWAQKAVAAGKRLGMTFTIGLPGQARVSYFLY